MQVLVENVSNVERRLTIVVPVTQVAETYEKQLKHFAKSAKIKGFRPGKVPVEYVKQRFDEEIRSKTFSEVIQATLTDAMLEHKLRPVSTPKIESKTFTLDTPFEYVASFEVLPEIAEIKFSANKIEKCIVEIKDEDIDRVITQLLKQFTKWNVIERPAKESDRVVIDYYAIFEGKSEEANKAQDFPLELGSKTMIPGFESGLLGVKSGEERTLHLKFPDAFHDKEKAGKDSDFVVKVKQVYEAELPHRDSDFFKRLGIKSGKEEDLKEHIKKTLLQERDRLVTEKLKAQVFQQLVDQNQIDIPKTLVENEAKRVHDEIYQQHQHDHQHNHAELDMFNDIAKKRVTLGLLVAEYAKKNNLKADKTKVQERIQDIASHYEKPHEVTAYLSEGEQLSGVEAQVMEDQVLEKLIEGLPVIEKEMSYAELKGIRI